MKHFKGNIERKLGVLTGKPNLEHLYTIKDFPVFMGCVSSPPEDDMVADMVWDICRDSGFIQLRNPLPLEILYLDQHNDGIGKIWQEHYKSFADFLYEFKPKSVLEIGGAHDQIANYYFEHDPSTKWATVEPNPQNISNKKIKVIKDWFDEDFKIDFDVDTVVHSHVFEHTYDPLSFMLNIGNFLQKGERHIFTFPDMVPMLKNKFTNCLNFEHTLFVTEEIAEFILSKAGFKILKKQYYGNPHSIFYATEKTDKKSNTDFPNHYEEYKKIFDDYINYHLSMVSELNKRILASFQKPVYLFGAHIFSQTLIKFGLNINNIASVLDNSPLKQGKRLYGTNLHVSSPGVLRDKGKVNVILKAGIYNEEIKKDILENINGQVEFW